MTTLQLRSADLPKTPPRILVVEDERIVAREIELSLGELGYDVVGRAASGAEAVAKAGALMPDLVLMDVRMPGGMDGIEAAEAIQRDQPIPIVFLSAFSDADTLRRATETNPFGYLVKPFRPAELTCAIELALRKTETERSLRRGKRVLETTLRAIGDAVVSTDPGGRITFMNLAAERLTGRTSADTRGELLDEALPLVRDDSSARSEWPLRAALGERTVRLLTERVRLARPGEVSVPIDDSAAPVIDDQGALLGGVVVFRDVTAQRSAEDKILRLNAELETRVAERTRELNEASAKLERYAHRLEGQVESSEERYRALLAAATDGVWILSRSGVLLDCNRRAEEIHGSPRDDLLGRHFTDTLPPDQVERAGGAFHRIFAEGFVRVDGIDIQRPDRTRRRVDFSACLLRFGGEEVIMTLERDVTDEYRLEEQNRQLQKLEAVGQLTGGVAHDFNNILGVILANSHFLLESLGGDDPRREDAQEIRDAGERGAALTRQLLAFSRKQVLEAQSIDLGSVVAGLEKMLVRVIGEDIDLVVKTAPDLEAVFADRGQLEQVVMNLVVNARDAMPQGGEIRIETASVVLDESYALGHAPVTPGRYVVLTVSDTGTGMDEETRQRAFEPFFTTKERGRGTGLGLSTCYGIIKQSGGFIWLYSEPGHGTLFKIHLPVSDRPTVDPVLPRDIGRLAGTETVFLIEDDPAISHVVSRILKDSGYQVVSARTADDADARARDYSGTIDLVLSDMVIPGGSGPSTALKVAARFPGARLLFMSGYSNHALLRNGVLPPNARFIQKPFPPGGLLRKVREVLDA